MHLGGLEVLPDREDVAAVRVEVAHDRVDLLGPLPEADHDARLRALTGVFGAADLLERALVARLRADLAVEPLDGLHVVTHDLLPAGDHAVERRPVAARVGDEGLDGRGGGPLLDLANGLVPDLGPAVLELVPVDARDDGVLDAHQVDGFRDAPGLILVVLARAAGLHRAEGAGARAGVAEDHEGGRPRAPALTHVGTVAALADGVELVLVYETADALVVLADGELDAEPVRLARAGLHRCDGLGNGDVRDDGEFDHAKRATAGRGGG